MFTFDVTNNGQEPTLSENSPRTSGWTHIP
jgi:hypothetical protein